MLQRRVRRPWLIVAVLAGAALTLTAANSYGSAYYWYGKDASTCWQSGFPGPSAQTCATVGPYFIGPQRVGVPNYSDGGIGPDTFTLPGEHCNYYKLRGFLDRFDGGNYATYTGYAPPGSPPTAYQMSNGLGDVCQANASIWGHRITGTETARCQSCGMHHYSSMGSSNDNNRPFAAQFGPHASLQIAAVNNQSNLEFTTTTPGGKGATGYMCPVFKAIGSNQYIEYCLETWRSHAGFPNVQEDQNCLGAQFTHLGSTHIIDSVWSYLSPNARFSSMIPGTSGTYVPPVGTRAVNGRSYRVTISRQDFKRALAALNVCRPRSQDPADYALVGLEQGLEGYNIASLGGFSLWGLMLTQVDTMFDEEILFAGEELSSNDGRWRLVMQPDGNLQVLGPLGVYFASGTAGHPGAFAKMQGDGQVVIWGASGPIWARGTSTGNGQKHQFVMQDDGNFVIYESGAPKWSSQYGYVTRRSAKLRLRSVPPPGGFGPPGARSLLKRSNRVPLRKLLAARS